MSGPTVRTFVAILLPDAVRARLAEIAGDLRAAAPRLAWVAPENLHLTLRFLGGLGPAALGAAGEAVTAAAAGAAPFAIGLAGLGAFPSTRAPRVVWAGIGAGADALAGLHGRLEAALADRGFPREGRPFHAHVTLARARDPRDGRRLAGALGGHDPIGRVSVEHIHLMRSDLHPRGARYHVLLEARLGSAGIPGGSGEHSSCVDMPPGAH